ncbi:MAG: hypothetical protein ACI9QD_000618 [Thermoproteota archaeon]|jgi:hypothetical protein
MKEEKKKVSIQKDIIDRIVKYLSTLGSLYNAPTINICHEIQGVIKEKNFLSREEQNMVANLDAHGIQSLLSYSSNCC